MFSTHTQTYFTNIPYCVVEDDVKRAHAASAKRYGWVNSSADLSGKYGHDTLATSAFFALAKLSKVSRRYTLSPLEKETLTNEVAESVHDGWSLAFRAWSEGKPWDIPNSGRVKPFKPLGGNDDPRTELSKTPFSSLPTEEKEKDLVIAKALVDHFTTPVGVTKWCPYVMVINNYYWIRNWFN